MSNFLTTAKKKLISDKRGVAAIEYALIAAFMAVALVAAVPLVTAALNGQFTSIAGHISTGK